jgi:3-hydroxyisobutyrate dehydrogenase-like beta-hydroxyacid dehydrogenase
MLKVPERIVVLMKIAFIGLGQMGKGMALNMVKSGAKLIVNDVRTDNFEEFEKRGATATTVLSDTAQADIIFLSLPNTSIVQSVLYGDNGLLPHLREGQTIVDLSTINYNATLEIGRVLGDKGVRFMDAPVSGMESRANDGTLTIMCGGEIDVFDEIKPYLECIGNKILFMGKLGSGQLTKLINQLLFDINVAALAEILPMSVKMGLDCEKVGQVVNSGTGRSYASEFFIPRILDGNFSEGYLMKHAYKDLISAAELGSNLTIPMPVLAAATSTYQMALLKGYGDYDKGGMIRVFEELLEVRYRKE